MINKSVDNLGLAKSCNKTAISPVACELTPPERYEESYNISETNDSLLHIAQNCEVVKLLLESGAEPLQANYQQVTPLDGMIRNEDTEIISSDKSSRIATHLRQLIVVINETFFKCVKDGNIDILRKLIKGGINVNIRDKYNDMALHHASKRGYKDIVQLLLEHGALVNDADCDNSPLELAVLYNHYEIIQLLLSYEANPNTFDFVGLTALHLAAEKGDIEILKLLLDKGGKVDILSNKTGNSLIHSAAIGIKEGNNECWI